MKMSSILSQLFKLALNFIYATFIYMYNVYTEYTDVKYGGELNDKT
jgi:hypothetical protein